ncbi:protein kinase [Candidatus Uabimicrobium sp. HlEnr_7]|uniref:protein kinase domain-containing protein n=1 Tax=Candidatus Uabimicrobium helgolandensis TaxID=3095367 RepID=UPI003557E1D9
MDDKKLRSLWKKIASDKELESQNSGMTYKSMSSDLTVIGDSQNANIEENTTILDKTVIESKNKSGGFLRSSSLKTSEHKIFGEIARGGMGAIFRGNQICLNREIAIKKMLSRNPQACERFVSEAMVTAFLDHPNIVPIYELSKNDSEEIMLAMKLVGGNSWDVVLDKEDLDFNLGILTNVCNAVAYAHSKNIVHNDLKPSNIMIGQFGEVLVMDWGLAVDISNTQEKRAIVKSEVTGPMGTPCYMPSELAEGRGEDIGEWTDIYLLGGILYRILAGKPPHTGETVFEVLRSSCTESTFNFPPQVPQEICEICRKALAFKKEKRYQNVAEFNYAIQNFIKHRESIFITEKAISNTNECKKNKNLLQTSKIYEKLAESISGLQQALELWSENSRACILLEEARNSYAQIAFDNGDLGLAEAQAAKMEMSQSKQDLQAKIIMAQQQKITAERWRRITNYSLVASLIAIFTIGIYSYFKIAKEKSIALQNALIADQQKNIAEDRRKDAEGLRREKEKESARIKTKMATIALAKVNTAKKSKNYSAVALYSSEALQFVHDIKNQVAKQAQVKKEIESIQKIGLENITNALEEHPLLWQTFDEKTIVKGATFPTWSPNGKYIAISLGNSVMLWNTNGEHYCTIETEQKAQMSCFSPQGKRLAIVEQNAIKIWNMDTLKSEKTLANHTDLVTFIAFFHDGEKLVSTSTDKTIRIWDIASGQQISQILHSDSIFRADLHLDSQRMAFSSQHNVGIVDLMTSKVVAQIGEDSKVTDVRYSDDVLAYSSHDSTIKLWDKNLNNIRKVLVGHKGIVNRFIFASRGKMISGANDGTIKIWDTDTGKYTVSSKHLSSVLYLAHHPHKNMWCSVTSGEIKLWKDDKFTRPFSGHVKEFFYHASTNKYTATSSKEEVRIWDIYSGKNIAIIAQKEAKRITFSKDSKILALSGNDVQLWDLSTKKFIGKIPIGKTIKHIAFHPKNEMLAIVANYNITTMWSTKTLQKVMDIETQCLNVSSLSFSPNGKKLLIASNSISAEVWNISEQKKHYDYKSKNSDGTLCLIGFDNDEKIQKALFNSTGEYFAILGERSGVYFWKLNNTSVNQMGYLANELYPYWDIDFSPHDSEKILLSNSLGVQINRIYWEKQVTGKKAATTTVQVIRQKGVLGASFCNDGKNIVTVLSRTIRVWQAKETDLRFLGRLATINADGSLIAWVEGEQAITIMDTKTYQKWKVSQQHDVSIVHLAFHPKKRILASADYQSIIFFHQILEDRTVTSETNIIGSSVSFSTDGKVATTDMQFEAAYVWDYKSGKQICEIEHEDFANHALLDPEGRFLATDNSDNIFLWDATTGEQLLAIPITKTIHTLSFKKPFSLFAVGTDNHAIIWDIKMSTERIKIGNPPIFKEKRSLVILNKNEQTISYKQKNSKVVDNNAKYIGVAEGKVVIQQLDTVSEQNVVVLLHLDKAKKIELQRNAAGKSFYWNTKKKKWIMRTDYAKLRGIVQLFFNKKVAKDMSLENVVPFSFLWSVK